MLNSKFSFFMATFFAFAVTGCATGPRLASEGRTASFIVEHPTMKKPDAYVKATTWVAKTFNSAKAVIQTQDKEAGKIVGKGYVHCNAVRQFLDTNDYDAGFVMDVTVKDGKSRLSFEAVEISLNGTTAMVNISTAADMEKTKTECLAPMAASFKTAMTDISKDNF